MKSISVVELKAMLDQGDDLALIDVRNPAEAEVAVIAGSELIPLDTLDSEEVIARIKAIAASRTVYVHCKLGGRSAKAVDVLASHGVDAVNVQGGIDAWSEEIDPSVPRY
jgi:adenylyltransferase/sulfurtransferase